MKTVPFQSDTQEVWERFPTFSGKLAFDIGANGGRVSQVLAANFDKVIAFEPAAESFEALADLPEGNIQASPLAVSDHTGAITLTETSVAMGRFGELVTIDNAPLAPIWGDVTGTREIPCATLDHLVETYGTPDFLKIDTEGHEAHVVEGGRGLFESSSPVLIIEVHSLSAGAKCQELLRGYEWIKYEHSAYRPDTFLRANHYWLEGHRGDV